MAGVAIGVGVWWQVSALIQQEVHGIDTLDLRVIVLVGSVLMSLTLLAAFWPAWTASRVSPLVALRAE